jgi:hypothetical protein
MPHAYTMENNRELIPLLEEKKTTYIIDNNCVLLKLPNEILDIIIFSNNSPTIGALKNSCKRLAELASLLKVDDQRIRQFIMPNKKARIALFKNIIKTDNPEYIKKILDYGKKEAHFHRERLENSTIIPVDTAAIEKCHLNQNYLCFLLRYAIKQNKYHSVSILINSGANTINGTTLTPLEYATDCDSDNAIQALFESIFFDREHIDKALGIAWTNDKNKALELLTTKITDEKTRASLKQEQCIWNIKLVCRPIVIMGLITGLVYGITFLVTNNPCYKNITLHCIN